MIFQRKHFTGKNYMKISLILFIIKGTHIVSKISFFSPMILKYPMMLPAREEGRKRAFQCGFERKWAHH